MEVRAATLEDAPALAAIVTEGIATYRAFAPPGWDPGPVADEVGRFAELLGADSRYRGWVAEHDGAPVGVGGWVPAGPHGPLPVDEPGLAHVRHLFVAERAWGTGAARVLHDVVLDDARRLGFTSSRLFCAEGQARARRFYEREGWTATGVELPHTPLGVPVLEYRRPL